MEGTPEKKECLYTPFRSKCTERLQKKRKMWGETLIPAENI
jgi:hypothetical protein